MEANGTGANAPWLNHTRKTKNSAHPQRYQRRANQVSRQVVPSGYGRRRSGGRMDKGRHSLERNEARQTDHWPPNSIQAFTYTHPDRETQARHRVCALPFASSLSVQHHPFTITITPTAPRTVDQHVDTDYCAAQPGCGPSFSSSASSSFLISSSSTDKSSRVT